MKILFKYSMFLGAIAVAGNTFAQGNPMNADRAVSENAPKTYVNSTWQPSLVPDGMIDRVPHVNKALQWNNIREIDIAFKRRIWKRIDVREKQNMPFIYEGDEYSGGGAFIEILVDAARRGLIRPFSDDKFTRVLTTEELDKNITGGATTQVVTNPITGEDSVIVTNGSFNPADITKYEVQEDWIYDRNMGRMITRIRAISPLMDVYDEDGNYRSYRRLFTVYYPEIRDVLSQYEVYNPENDVRRMTWTDYLDRLYYSGYVIKTSHNNPTGQNIPGGGLDALTKGQKEMQSIINKEQDMWEL